jgi:hypothetical protein
MQIFLRVPYGQKNHAKANGAHWCQSRKRWYVIDPASFRKCVRWYDGEMTEAIKTWLDDPIREQRYRDALQQYKEENQHT